MLTEAATPVNAPRTVMLSIAALAERDRVSKPAVSRKVKQLVEKHGLAVERDDQGRVAAVNAAEYDHLRGRFGDPSKAQAPAAKGSATGPTPENESYDEALRQKTWHDAERARIALDELKGKLVRLEALTEGLRLTAGEIAAVIDRLPNAADELAAAVARDGTHGLRVMLKQLAKDQRHAIANALAAIGAAAPEIEPEDLEGLEAAE
ncbi:MAG: hypothetical protein WD118_08805 [Phycisphaeraceae bacterium]